MSLAVVGHAQVGNGVLLARRGASNLAPAEFASIAEDTLQELQDKLDAASLDADQDISYSDGVLTIKLGGKGTYVINKQSPNQQLWFSSPISGPKRFEHSSEGQWLDTRNRESLHKILFAELEQLTGTKL